MNFNLKKLKTNRQYCAIIGLKERMFEQLLIDFEKVYLEKYKHSLRKRLPKELSHIYQIKTEKMLLFFILFSLKNPLTYDVLGFIFNMDASCAKRNREKGLELLEETLSKIGVLPKRNLLNHEELMECFAKIDTLIMDVTEYRINRPFYQQIQSDCYSGKKKCHTLKTLLITDEEKMIHYIGEIHVGKVHDYSILKYSFDPEKENWFKNHHLRVDLGFLGIAKDDTFKALDIPHKKPRNGELTDEQKKENKEKAAIRITVEHGISGLKRYRILSERVRMRDFDLFNKIIGICAGLWNFYLTASKP